MPRHLISDAHEWINEIPTVPIYYLAKPQQRERRAYSFNVVKRRGFYFFINEILKLKLFSLLMFKILAAI